MNIENISGIGEYTKTERVIPETEERNEIFLVGAGGGRAFLVVRPKTIEVRCDRKLGQSLREKYETVMESRYVGKGGIEIVPSGQLEDSEIEDLVRLSYNLTKESEEYESGNEAK